MVQNYFNYADGCSSQCGLAPACKDKGILKCKECFTVLNYSTMVSVLSEASNITNDANEEGLFETSELRLAEAQGLYHGLMSYINGAGIATVKTRWLGGDSGQLRVDGDLKISPYVTCWGQFEQYSLQADYQYLGGYYCIPHHWLEVETGYTMPDPIWIVSVTPGESTHTYIAYYTGGFI